jgi:ABC-type sugar transport system substrate-binding protein
LINEGFPKEKYKEFGKPKEIFKNWILEYLPDDFTAGYLLGKELINKAIKTKNFDKNGFINIFALLGTTRTTSSLLRGKGLKKSIEEYEGIVKIKLLQSVRANWNMVRSEEIITSALKRYENINIIWSASDEMALGAKKAIEKSKINRKILLGGIDWSLFSFDEVKNGDFVATIGGHFMDAGWALIMAYDDFNGITINNRQLKSKFYVINSENVDLFSKYFKLNYWNNVDFKKFSRFLNKKSTYDFSYESVIKMLELNDESTTK